MKDRLRRIRNSSRRSLFRAAERLGIHITPVHFYSPIPKVSELKPELFTQPNACVGLDFRVAAQRSYLQSVFPRYFAEYSPPVNTGLSRIDAFVLYALIRERKPKVVIEIGSGESTKIALAALAKNHSEGANGQLIAIEPYPRPFLKAMRDPRLTLVEKKVQDVDVEHFRDTDLLFIDSSHVSKIGSDVNYEMFDIVPRLKVGALIHWHDIMIPMDYSRSWIESGTKFWNESYLLHAFMLFNKSFNVIWGSRYMQVNHAIELRETFSYFDPADPDQQLSSFWIERTAC
jgi:hypothetical protein